MSCFTYLHVYFLSRLCYYKLVSNHITFYSYLDKVKNLHLCCTLMQHWDIDHQVKNGPLYTRRLLNYFIIGMLPIYVFFRGIFRLDPCEVAIDGIKVAVKTWNCIFTVGGLIESN